MTNTRRFMASYVHD